MPFTIIYQCSVELLDGDLHGVLADLHLAGEIENVLANLKKHLSCILINIFLDGAYSSVTKALARECRQEQEKGA